MLRLRRAVKNTDDRDITHVPVVFSSATTPVPSVAAGSPRSGRVPRPVSVRSGRVPRPVSVRSDRVPRPVSTAAAGLPGPFPSVAAGFPGPFPPAAAGFSGPFPPQRPDSPSTLHHKENTIQNRKMKQIIRKPNRLRDYDYSSNGAYFVTVCTQNRVHCLSGIRQMEQGVQVKLTWQGEIVSRWIDRIPEKYPTVIVEHSVIMPNHVHMLLRIERGDRTGDPSATEGDRMGNPSATEGDRTGNPSATEGDRTGNPSATEGNGTGNPSATEGDRTGDPSATDCEAPSLGTILGWWKYQTTKEINSVRSERTQVWQRSYYDHVIRDLSDFEIRWNYIENNPYRWAEDKYYSEEVN